jgi:hypothetical protein
LNSSVNVVRLVLAILFGIYQFAAFRKNKPLFYKLLPMIVAVVLGLLLIALAPFAGPLGLLAVFVILMIELSQIGIMIVLLIEIYLALADRKIKRGIILSVILTLLVVVYFLGERFF